MPKKFHKRRNNMALDPATISMVVGAIAKRVIDTKKPLGKTNAATAGGVGLGGAAAYLINTGDPTMVLIGYGLGLVGGLLALYKEKDK